MSFLNFNPNSVLNSSSFSINIDNNTAMEVDDICQSVPTILQYPQYSENEISRRLPLITKHSG
jgi:hypothetical protein